MGITNIKWKKFNNLTEKCYDNMVGANPDRTCWRKAFEILKEIIGEERGKDASYAPELYLLDDVTDFEYDVQGWMEDYVGELEISQGWDELLKICTDMLELFEWKSDSPSEFQFLRISALNNLGRNEEAVSLSRAWIEKEADNMLAVSAGVYANMYSHDFEEAESLIKRYITEDTECTDENDVLFIAAGEFYKAAGNEKEGKRIEKLLEEYDQVLEEELAEWDGEDEFPFL